MTITVEDMEDDSSTLRIQVSCNPQTIDTDKATPCEQAALRLIAVVAAYAAEKATQRTCDVTH